jgi:hypothetical protein
MPPTKSEVSNFIAKYKADPSTGGTFSGGDGGARVKALGGKGNVYTNTQPRASLQEDLPDPYQGTDQAGFIKYLAQNKILTDNSQKGIDEAISVSNLAGTSPSPIVIPPAPESPYNPNLITAGNQGLIAGATPPPEIKTDPATDWASKELAKLNEGVVTGEEAYLKTEKELKLKQKQQILNDANARLLAITNQQTADIMAIRNQSSTEGGTAGILSAREDAINRSAVIKALPIQAEVALAQDNLQYAQDRLDTLTAIRREDNQNIYDRGIKLIELTYNSMTNKQKEAADLLKENRQRNYEIIDKNISRQDAWAKEFKDSNQPGLMTQVLGLDPSDATFETKLSALTRSYNGAAGTENNLFTQTQLNSGAATAGLPLDEFSTLGKDVKNFLINQPTEDVQDVLGVIRNAKTQGDVEDAKTNISEMAVSQPVKDWLTSQLVVSEKSNWEKVKNFFGF